MAEQKSFCHFLELVPELGMLIIDKMEVYDRCRFLGSSKVCNKKAKDSKNYIYGLDIYASEGYSTIIVKHGYSHGFVLIFKEEYNNKIMKCAKWRDNVELWRTQLDNSTDLFLIVIEKFKVLLQKYGNTIKKLDINVLSGSEPVDFEVKSLKNLEMLRVHHDIDIRQFISKTKKSLTKLVVSGQMNGRFLENQDEIFQVKEHLESTYTRLNNQQFLRLSASSVHIHIGQLTEEDIYNFVRSWQNGTIRNEKVQFCQWNLGDSKFDVKKVFELFGDDSKQKLDFEREGDATRVARLSFLFRSLCFRILSPEEIGRRVS